MTRFCRGDDTAGEQRGCWLPGLPSALPGPAPHIHPLSVVVPFTRRALRPCPGDMVHVLALPRDALPSLSLTAKPHPFFQAIQSPLPWGNLSWDGRKKVPWVKSQKLWVEHFSSATKCVTRRSL